MYDEQDLENPSHTIEEREDKREKKSPTHIYDQWTERGKVHLMIYIYYDRCHALWNESDRTRKRKRSKERGEECIWSS